MLDEFTWKVFSQTGNIETYLLLKELENGSGPKENYFLNQEINEQKENYYEEFNQ